MRKLLLVPALLLTLSASPAFALSDMPYIMPGQVDLIHLLPPPPAANSPEQQADIQAVVAIDNMRTDMEADRARKDAVVTIFRFNDALLATLTQDMVPTLVAFFGKINRETGPLGNMAKDCWERPRPFVASSDVHALDDVAETTRNRPGTTNTAPHDAGSPCSTAEPVPTFNYSYPSGHATFGAMTAILLAEMVPEKRATLFDRGWEYGRNRVVAGVHFPTDVASGRIAATVMVSAMMQNPGFKTDLAAAKAELRHALGLMP